MKNAIRFIALLACMLGAAAASAATLTTTYAGGNGQNGIMFNVVAKQDVTITRFDVHLEPANTGDAIQIYGRSGSYAGFSNSSTGWTLLGSATVTVNNGTGNPSPIAITLNQPIMSGATYAFYITRPNDGVQYTDGTAEFAVYAENADLQIQEGRGIEHPFGENFVPRVFNGTVHYELGVTAPPVPTASEWALIAMALGLALLAFTRLR